MHSACVLPGASRRRRWRVGERTPACAVVADVDRRFADASEVALVRADAHADDAIAERRGSVGRKSAEALWSGREHDLAAPRRGALEAGFFVGEERCVGGVGVDPREHAAIAGRDEPGGRGLERVDGLLRAERDLAPGAVREPATSPPSPPTHSEPSMLATAKSAGPEVFSGVTSPSRTASTSPAVVVATMAPSCSTSAESARREHSTTSTASLPASTSSPSAVPKAIRSSESGSIDVSHAPASNAGSQAAPSPRSSR